MADRISALEAEKAALEATILSTTPKGKTPPVMPATSDDPGVAQLRLDLAEALRSKGITEARLRASDEELEKLRAKTKDDSKAIRTLDAERTILKTRLKDREYELKEKRKLLEVSTGFSHFHMATENLTLSARMCKTK
jgi:hypothetical protein